MSEGTLGTKEAEKVRAGKLTGILRPLDFALCVIGSQWRILSKRGICFALGFHCSYDSVLGKGWKGRSWATAQEDVV